MKIGVALVTGVVLALCSVGTGLLAMVLANGFMSNTDPMAWSYLACNAVSILFLSVFNGWLTHFLQHKFKLNPWLGGLFSIAVAMILFGILIFAAFFAIVTIFGS